MSGQIVFKVENTDEFSLVDQWQRENGARATLKDVGIGRERILRRCILENHSFLSTHYVVHKRLRHCGRSFGTVLESYGYVTFASSRLRLYSQLVTSRDNQ